MPLPSSPVLDAISNSRLTAWLLVGVNVVIGVQAFTQRFGYAEVLLLYLAETVVIGVLTIPKLLIVALFAKRIDTAEQLRTAGNRALSVLALLIFYLAAFVFAWGLLFAMIAILPILLDDNDRAAGFVVPRESSDERGSLELAFAALALSHATSFVVNFLFGREFRGGSLIQIAVQPFLRTALIWVVMSLATVVAIVQGAVSQSAAFALVVIGAKTAVDLRGHLAERKRFRYPAAPETASPSGA